MREVSHFGREKHGRNRKITSSCTQELSDEQRRIFSGGDEETHFEYIVALFQPNRGDSLFRPFPSHLERERTNQRSALADIALTLIIRGWEKSYIFAGSSHTFSLPE